MYVIMSVAFAIFLTDEGGEEKGEGRREKEKEIHGAYKKIR